MKDFFNNLFWRILVGVFGLIGGTVLGGVIAGGLGASIGAVLFGIIGFLNPNSMFED